MGEQRTLARGVIYVLNWIRIDDWCGGSARVVVEVINASSL